jgi:hypothetical protein
MVRYKMNLPEEIIDESTPKKQMSVHDGKSELNTHEEKR